MNILNCNADNEYSMNTTLWVYPYGQPYHLGITEALSQLWQQDFLKSSLCQLVAAVAAPHIHHDCVALSTRSSCISAAGAQAVGC